MKLEVISNKLKKQFHNIDFSSELDDDEEGNIDEIF